jgi:hypothetical protein
MSMQLMRYEDQSKSPLTDEEKGHAGIQAVVIK